MPNASKPQHAVPPDACDCHMHVYEPGYPIAATAVAAPPPGRLADYLAVRARLGLTRTVVVQPTAYGADNSCTLAAVAALGTGARGVAMVTGDESDGELERLSLGGITGYRFRTFPGGVLTWKQLDRMAARAQDLRWHTDIEMDGRTLPEHAAAIARLPGTLVIDHIGKFLEPVPLDHPGVGVLLRLIDSGRTYVKITSPYDSSRSGPPDYADLRDLVGLLVRSAPERLIFATNWPHAALAPDQRPDDAAWLDLMSEWMDEATRRRMLVDNPAALHGF
jgi:D-galactarolactone isomerase